MENLMAGDLCSVENNGRLESVISCVGEWLFIVIETRGIKKNGKWLKIEWSENKKKGNLRNWNFFLIFMISI